MCPTIDVLISTWALIHDNGGRIIYVLQYLFKYSLFISIRLFYAYLYTTTLRQL